MFGWFKKKGGEKEELLEVGIPWDMPEKKFKKLLKKCIADLSSDDIDKLIVHLKSSTLTGFSAHVSSTERELLLRNGFTESERERLYDDADELKFISADCGCSTICRGCTSYNNVAYTKFFPGEHNIIPLNCGD